jgi:hypothetical protein
MKHYTIKEFNDRALLKEEKLQEMSFVVNTVQDAENVIRICVKIIMNKKQMNTTLCADFITNGIISGIDSADEIFPKISQKIIEKKKLVLSKKIKTILNSYIATK